MGKKTYFISDVHLSIVDTDKEQLKRKKLISFLKMIEQDAEELYILGDLFDFWFEWYHVIPKYFFPVFYQLKHLVDSGVRVIFLAGNHDFKLGGYLERSVGLKTLPHSLELNLDNKRLFLIHGDGWGKGDLGYKILKKIIRNRISVFLFKTLISADLGMWIARTVSNTSRTVKNKDRSHWLKKFFLDRAKEKFKEGFDFVIMGHLHSPLRIQEGNGELICLGDFISYYTYLEYDQNNFKLKTFEKVE